MQDESCNNTVDKHAIHRELEVCEVIDLPMNLMLSGESRVQPLRLRWPSRGLYLWRTRRMALSVTLQGNNVHHCTSLQCTGMHIDHSGYIHYKVHSPVGNRKDIYLRFGEQK